MYQHMNLPHLAPPLSVCPPTRGCVQDVGEQRVITITLPSTKFVVKHEEATSTLPPPQQQQQQQQQQRVQEIKASLSRPVDGEDHRMNSIPLTPGTTQQEEEEQQQEEEEVEEHDLRSSPFPSNASLDEEAKANDAALVMGATVSGAERDDDGGSAHKRAKLTLPSVPDTSAARPIARAEADAEAEEQAARQSLDGTAGGVVDGSAHLQGDSSNNAFEDDQAYRHDDDDDDDDDDDVEQEEEGGGEGKEKLQSASTAAATTTATAAAAGDMPGVHQYPRYFKAARAPATSAEINGCYVRVFEDKPGSPVYKHIHHEVFFFYNSLDNSWNFGPHPPDAAEQQVDCVFAFCRAEEVAEHTPVATFDLVWSFVDPSTHEFARSPSFQLSVVSPDRKHEQGFVKERLRDVLALTRTERQLELFRQRKGTAKLKARAISRKTVKTIKHRCACVHVCMRLRVCMRVL